MDGEESGPRRPSPIATRGHQEEDNKIRVINAKEQLLIELSHVPLALFGVAAGWARWLELRLDPPAGRIAGRVWPVCLVLVGLVLLNYREA